MNKYMAFLCIIGMYILHPIHATYDEESHGYYEKKPVQCIYIENKKVSWVFIRMLRKEFRNLPSAFFGIQANQDETETAYDPY